MFGRKRQDTSPMSGVPKTPEEFSQTIWDAIALLRAYDDNRIKDITMLLSEPGQIWKLNAMSSIASGLLWQISQVTGKPVSKILDDYSLALTEVTK